jgi:hypothetical protein
MKNITLAFITGIILAVFTFHAHTVYQFRKTLAAHEGALVQIINVLNQANPQQ